MAGLPLIVVAEFPSFNDLKLPWYDTIFLCFPDVAIVTPSDICSDCTLKVSYQSLNNALKEQCIAINTHEAIIHKLSYQVNNPPLYKIGQKVKEYGTCVNVELITEVRAHVRAEYRYDYTFIKNNKTMIVS